MAESIEQEKISFNISSRIKDLKEKEKEQYAHIKDLNVARNYVAEKLKKMVLLKNCEEEFEKYDGTVFQKEEMDAIVKFEEVQRNYFAKKRYLLPFSIVAVLGFMGVFKQSLSIQTFNENIHLIAPIFLGTYLVGNTFINLGLKSKSRSYEKYLDTVLAKARLHSYCVSLINHLKFDEDRHLE